MNKQSATGRIPNYPQHGGEGIDYDNMTMLNFDYAELERNMARASVENAALRVWAGGTNPNLKVRFAPNPEGGVGMWVHYGSFGAMWLAGSQIEALRAHGYRVTVEHRRNYYDVGTDTVLLLNPTQVKVNIAQGTVYFYEGRDPMWTSFDINPLPHGGDTCVRVYSPSGHWAEGIAVCSNDDSFNKVTGRSLALTRALERLNEVVHG